MSQSPPNDPIWIESTLIASADPLTKTYCINADGVPQVSKHPFLAGGMAHRTRFHADTFTTEFAQLLTDLHNHECIVLGSMSDDVVGDKGQKVSRNDSPIRHFGLIVSHEQFKDIQEKLNRAGIEFIREPQISYEGKLREQRTMVCSDSCGNALEFKGMPDVERIFLD